jgi:16S rRNA (guanine527-N7)-methyltransferase
MQIILKYFPDLTEKQIYQIQQLQSLYNLWNERINVISRKDIDQLYERHVLHSLSIASFFKFNKGTRILDVGTGGGFPGIPLAILYPEVEFTLTDSIGKKITVVKEVSESLGLNNITAIHARVESLPEKYDFVVSRAVTEFPKFVAWVRTKIEKKKINNFANGIIYIKGGDFESELVKFSKAKVYSISDKFSEPYFETKKIIYLPID